MVCLNHLQKRKNYCLGRSSLSAVCLYGNGGAMLLRVLSSETAIRVNLAIMRAFVAMRNYVMTTTTVTTELAEIRARLALLEQTGKDNAEAVIDLSEDMRKELDNIYEAIATLSVKVPQTRKFPQPIGVKK